MKCVTRKSFSQLSRRQQYTRLLNRKVALEKNKKDKISLDRDRINDTSNNDTNKNNEDSSAADERDVSHEEKLTDISDRISSNQSDSVKILLERVTRDKNEDLANCTAEDIYVDSLTNFRNVLRQCCLDMDINQIQAGALLCDTFVWANFLYNY